MLLCGCRPGEVWGLKTSDYDGLTLTVRRSVNARGKITPGKNKNAHRVIPLHPLARQIIDETIKRNEYLKTPWIFPGKSGGRCYPQTAAKEWRVFAASRGLPGSPYCLRHTSGIKKDPAPGTGSLRGIILDGYRYTTESYRKDEKRRAWHAPLFFLIYYFNLKSSLPFQFFIHQPGRSANLYQPPTQSETLTVCP